MTLRGQCVLYPTPKGPWEFKHGRAGWPDAKTSAGGSALRINIIIIIMPPSAAPKQTDRPENSLTRQPRALLSTNSLHGGSIHLLFLTAVVSHSVHYTQTLSPHWESSAASTDGTDDFHKRAWPGPAYLCPASRIPLLVRPQFHRHGCCCVPHFFHQELRLMESEEAWGGGREGAESGGMQGDALDGCRVRRRGTRVYGRKHLRHVTSDWSF